MSEVIRQRAVDFLADRRQPVVGPVLAEAIGADPMELAFLLAYPLALNVIRTWRVGALSMWSISTGDLPEPDHHTRQIRRMVPAASGQLELSSEES